MEVEVRGVRLVVELDYASLCFVSSLGFRL